jgi:hypothetical protein
VQALRTIGGVREIYRERGTCHHLRCGSTYQLLHLYLFTSHHVPSHCSSHTFPLTCFLLSIQNELDFFASGGSSTFIKLMITLDPLLCTPPDIPEEISRYAQLCRAVLYCDVMSCDVLYCDVMCCTVLYCAVLCSYVCCAVPCFMVSIKRVRNSLSSSESL